MAKEEITQSEWQIMEVVWADGAPLTSSEVYKRMQGNADMSQRMVRVLMNRLNQKNILGYTGFKSLSLLCLKVKGGMCGGKNTEVCRELF